MTSRPCPRRWFVLALAGLALAFLLASWAPGRRPDRPLGQGRAAAPPVAESPPPVQGGEAELRSAEFAAWAGAQRWVPDEIVAARLTVGFEPGVGVAARRQLAAGLGATVERDRTRRDGSGVTVLALPSDASLRAAVEACRRHEGVRYAQPLFRARPLTNDPHYPDLWGLENTGQEVGQIAGTLDADIDAPEAWLVHSPVETAVIAVIDNGVDFGHPDLAPVTWYNADERGGGKENNSQDDDGNGYTDDWRGWDFQDNDNNPSYDLGGEKPSHGTDVALVAAGVGDNGQAGVGVARSALVMHLRALYDTEVAEAIEYATNNGARICSISLGQNSYSSVEYSAIDYARSQGVLVCAAAGNDYSNNDTTAHYPSGYALDNIIAVAASDQDDWLWYTGPGNGSNYGVTTVDLAAPGHNIRVSGYARTVHFEHDFASATLFADDFDDNDFGTDWSLGQDPGDTNEWENDSGYATPNLYRPYTGNARTWIESRTFSTDGYSLVGLSYFYFVTSEAVDDYLSVEVYDGVSWHEVARHTSPANGANVQGVASVAITAHSGPNTRIRFVWRTDGDNNDYDGAFVDDVQVSGVASGLVSGGTAEWSPVHTPIQGGGELEGVVPSGHGSPPYPPNADSWVASAAPFDTAGAQELTLLYYYSVDSESGYDYLAVEVWDGGQWQELARHSGEGGWITPAIVDVTAYANAQMQVRFHWLSDGSNGSYDGAAVYHAEVSSVPGTRANTALDEFLPSYAEGTSVATPLVAGTAALIWSQYPDLRYHEVRAAILDNVDNDPVDQQDLIGTSVTGGRLNAYAALTGVPSTAPSAPLNLAADPPSWSSINSFDLSWLNPAHPLTIVEARYNVGDVP